MSNPNEFDEAQWERWFWLEHEPSCPNREMHAHKSPPAWLVAELVNGPAPTPEPEAIEFERRQQELEERTRRAEFLLDRMQRRMVLKTDLLHALERFRDHRTIANATAVMDLAKELQSFLS